MFVFVGDSLRETNASPEQRAALYAVAARIPGVDLVGPVTDSAGRRGIAVAKDDNVNHIRSTLVFDPRTSVLLAEEESTANGQQPTANVIRARESERSSFPALESCRASRLASPFRGRPSRR